MTRSLVQIILAALVSIAGLVGTLRADGGWGWLFLALAVLPLMLGVVMIARYITRETMEFCDDMSASSAEW